MSEIERWAIESGLADPDLSSTAGHLMTDYGSASEATMAFAALVRAAERERCAQVCEALGARDWFEVGAVVRAATRECAAAIRRG